MKIINIFGESGAGKSTVASGLFYAMKINFYEVELTQEYAKILTWSKRYIDLSDQLKITAKQHHYLHMLKNKVDYVITDSPLILGLIYKPNNYFKSFDNLVLDLYNSYDNINILLKRKFKYNINGRNESEIESINKRNQLVDILNNNKINYIEFDSNKKSANNIFNYLKTNKLI